MKKYGLNELREMFLNYYETKNGHLRLPSFSLIPHNDKSLLLINSGMAPLKPYFTGQETPPRKRVTTCQKCIRTPDIENVGKTARHGTFFEMLGNFSFGDYFKKEAITWAWEFLTEVVGIDKSLLYASIYEDDDEAYDLWHDMIGLTPDHITRLGKEDNFWEIGLGPCGPCSEIYVDRGEKYGCGKPTCGVGCDCDRFVEVWNLVFTQFDKDENGNYNRLEHPNIDTGMGLERLAVVCQEVDNLFEVDTIRFVLDYICERAKVEYGKEHENDVSIRVITDHIRSVVFMLSDGVIPSNEGRGYVLRRLFRRAVRHGKKLGINDMFMVDVAKKVIETSSKAYPALSENEEMILKMISVEEARFNETISQGTQMINELITKLKSEEKDCISGEDAFKLYDTFGFPVDVTLEMAQEQSMDVDMDGFTAEMKKQKAASKDAHAKQEIEGWKDELTEIVSGMKATVFSGYDKLDDKGRVVCLVQNSEAVDLVEAPANCVVLTDTTPFYAKSGGQLGDSGEISSTGAKGTVTDTLKSGDKFAHYVTLTEGKISIGDELDMHVNAEKRLNTQRNHTSTHLLHKALKMVLGNHVNQAGSEVSEDRLRFDFSHFEKMTEEQIKEVEKIVNDEILKCIPVSKFTASLNEAKKMGATALFGEKYTDTVRVIKIGDFSMELCGGCHLDNTGYAGMFKILSETGIAAGVRRIEAVTGKKAYEYVNSLQGSIHEAAATAKTSPEMLVQRIEDMNNNISKLHKELAALLGKANTEKVDELLNDKISKNGIDYIFKNIGEGDINTLRDLSDKLKDKLECGVALLVSTSNGKGLILASATPKAVEAGFNCGKFIKEVAASIGSGGGGKPDMAQAGFKDISKADACISNAINMIK